MSKNIKNYTSNDNEKNQIDFSRQQDKLVDDAIERTYDENQGMSEESYIKTLYPKDHEEYLVDGAVLVCNMATPLPQRLFGKTFFPKKPSNITMLKVTENPKAKCCGELRHATIKDCKKNKNIEPFRCNCLLLPYDATEWNNVMSDKSCLTEGTCRAFMNLNEQWENFPTETKYLTFGDDECENISGINRTSMLFCKHGGLITPVTSGQIR